MKKFNSIFMVAVVLLVMIVGACPSQGNQDALTQVSIEGAKWYINDEITNPGSPAEGLLMNVRIVIG